MLVLALARALELQRPYSDQPAVGCNQCRAAPVRVRGEGEDGFIEHVFPIARKFLLGRDPTRERARAAARPADHDAFTDLRGFRGSEGQRLNLDPAKRLHQAKSRLLIEAERMALDNATVAQMQPDRIRFGDQIADREHESVFDQHAVAGALDAERFGRECIGRDDGVQPDNGSERAVEIIRIVLGARLHRLRHLPFNQRGHRKLLCTFSIIRRIKPAKRPPLPVSLRAGP